MNSLIVVIAILFFLVWFISSVSAMVFWFQVPTHKLKNEQTDNTKRIAYYYGFAFFCFLCFVAVGSMVAVFAAIIIKGLGI